MTLLAQQVRGMDADVSMICPVPIDIDLLYLSHVAESDRLVRSTDLERIPSANRQLEHFGPAGPSVTVNPKCGCRVPRQKRSMTGIPVFLDQVSSPLCHSLHSGVYIALSDQRKDADIYHTQVFSIVHSTSIVDHSTVIPRRHCACVRRMKNCIESLSGNLFSCFEARDVYSQR